MRVITFGAKPPSVESQQIIDSAISGAHKYYNLLVEQERAHTAEKAELRRIHLPGITEAESAIERISVELESLRASIKARNAAERRRAGTPADRSAITELQNQLKAARNRRKAILASAAESPEYVAACDALHQKKLANRREAYAAAQCNWGTRSKVVEALERASESSTPPGNPSFRRWSGDGIVAIQIQGGTTWADMLAGTDARIRVTDLKERGRCKGARAIMHLRLADRPENVTISIPVYLNRKFSEYWPADGVVTWATLVRRVLPVRRGSNGQWRPHYEWSVQLTVRTAVEKSAAPRGVCGVNLGWRSRNEHRLRVAYWQGDDGNGGELTLDSSAWHHVDDLHSIIAGHLEETRNAVANWLKDNHDRLSESMREKTDSLFQWRSPSRLARLASTWERTEGDESIYAMLLAYQEKVNHLMQTEAGLRIKSVARRLDQYRKFAAGLARRYGTICVEDTDYRKLKRNEVAESTDAVNQTAKRNATIAAVGLLRNALKQSGAKVLTLPARDITRTCHACGSVESWDQESELTHVCSGCGQSWDQDENAARNLLASGVALAESLVVDRDPDDDAGEGVATVKPATSNRWAMRKAKAIERRGLTKSKAG